MFKIIQSHRTEYLVDELLKAYRSKNLPIFAEFIVIVPSMVLGDWLDKSIASQAGISTLVTTKFWGQYQWTLMQKVLAEHNVWLENHDNQQQQITVPEVAVLTGAVMQWRLFGYFTYYQAIIMRDETHPLHPLLSALLDEQADRSQQDIRLWSLATDFARVFGRYLTHREEWLSRWSKDDKIDVEALIKEKDELSKRFDDYAGVTPEWLVAHYVELEAAQRHLWRLLFASVYEHRADIETRFWQIMQSAKANVANATQSLKNDKPSSNKKPVTADFETGVDIEAILPKQLHIFTIQQLPQNELDFLQKLSTYMDITLLHYNPSQLFWADIVDKQWLQRQQVINPKSVFLRDYGHTLLSRLGKQSRETFAMLAGLDNHDNKDGFQLIWQDKFEIEEASAANLSSGLPLSALQPMSLLAHLQQDVLMLDEGATQQTTAGRLSAALNTQLQLDLAEDAVELEEPWFSDDQLNNKRLEPLRPWQLSQYDNSLSIHSCHNLQRQLEILRGMIGRWLNDPSSDGSARHLSDIVVLLPDVERHHELISSVFVSGKGQDGLTLPAKVTGVVDKSIRQLWEAISGFYTLLGSDTARFESAIVLDWLMLPPLYESLGLTHEQMGRACDLLEQAGFIRGFDEAHLQQTLDAQDYDYRFSFAHALDQIALGLVMPAAGISDCLYPDNWQSDALREKTVPIAAISLADAPIIEALCRVHAGLNHCRFEYQQRFKAEEWLGRIENQIIHLFFGALDQTRPMRAIFNAMNGFKSSLRANRHYQQYSGQSHSQTHSQTHSQSGQQSFSTTQDHAQQVEAQLSQVSTLPLKLSFMLDSIEDELESQQVSAEPTGVITFGRFGALRNVPFGLVVMLNMDLSEFPNRDRDNRYDLMKAGLAKRGDRFSEDDDNGAFLDAMLCARDACWIFYNGQRLTDTHEHLPANPVSELLQFLQGEVQWQWEPLDKEQQALTVATDPEARLTTQIQRYMPKLIEQWLVTKHPALPFAAELFLESNSDNSHSLHEAASSDSPYDDGQMLIAQLDNAMLREKRYQQSTNAPAKIWQDVFERLHAQEEYADFMIADDTTDSAYSMVSEPTLSKAALNATRRPLKVKLPSQVECETIAQRIILDHPLFSADNNLNAACLNNPKLNTVEFAVSQVDMQRLYYQVRHPAKHFLREQQVHIVEAAEDTIQQEPLALSGLGAYEINSQLLKDLSLNQTIAADDNLLYHSVLPAGVARRSALDYQHLKITQQCQDFAEQLASLGIASNDIMTDSNKDAIRLLTPTHETMISVEAADMNAQHQLQIKGLVPVQTQVKAQINVQIAQGVDDVKSPTTWLNILPNSARTQHLLRFWLAHVYWQVARHTTEQQVIDNDGRSIWRFNKPSGEHKKYENSSTYELAPIAYDSALAELLKWIRFAHIAGKTPLTVLPVHALSYLDLLNKAQKEGVDYQPKRHDFSNWLWPSYHSDSVYDTCAEHELWRYILQNQDAFAALKQGLSLAEPLFAMMNEALKPL